MFVNFKETFNPSLEKRNKLADATNKLIEKKLRKYGNSCMTCTCRRYIQDSPYSDHLECDITGRVIDPNNPINCCVLYHFEGYVSPDHFRTPYKEDKEEEDGE